MAARKQKAHSKKTPSTSRDTANTFHSPPPKTWQLFVAYPPEELGRKNILESDISKLPNTYVTEYDLRKKRYSEVDELDSIDSIFRATNQPLLSLQIFVLTAKLEIYPPLAVIGHLASGIHKYLEAGGTTRLDECLGLVGKPGEDTHFGKWKNWNRDMWLRQAMILLRKTFKSTIEEAAFLVSKLPNSLSPATLENRFKKDHQWKINRKILEPAEWFQLRTIDVQKNFLKNFPYDSLPARIKPYHPDHRR